jgi:hypothetical protein
LASPLGPNWDTDSYAHCSTDTYANLISRNNTVAYPDSHSYGYRYRDGYHPADTSTDPVSRNNTVADSNCDGHRYRDGRAYCHAGPSPKPFDAHVRSGR